MMVDKLSNFLAKRIHNHALNPHSVAVLKYAIGNLLNLLATIVIVLLICTLTGDTLRGLIAVFSFVFLRQISGGLHFKSADVCNFVSAGMVLAAVYIPTVYQPIGMSLTVLSAIILLIYAPSGMNDPRVRRNRTATKLFCIMIVASNFYFESGLLAAVFFIQSLSTLRVLHRIIDEYKL